ncbi:hypothetical protein NL108_012143 [Boleophthalmus pectinirostris]|nr:hypothetical protein NL108_012143 [Boleophthalmus pectinirostris]
MALCRSCRGKIKKKIAKIIEKYEKIAKKYGFTRFIHKIRDCDTEILGEIKKNKKKKMLVKWREKLLRKIYIMYKIDHTERLQCDAQVVGEKIRKKTKKLKLM